jgi:lysyl-tRNA synthetase class 2
VDRNGALIRRREALRQRAALLQAVRHYFIDHGYLEVETPHRIPAPAPESYIDAIPSGDWFLHTSPELCMKRLLAVDYEKIFQICRCWREGERGTLHLPEFTLLEWYRAGSDYRALMEECEELLPFIAHRLGRGPEVSFRDRTVSLVPPWERVTVREAFDRFAGLSMEDALKTGRFDEVMVEAIEPRLGIERSTFLMDYPAERGALARLNPGDPTTVERFELYIGGLEIANAFSELTDPAEQRERFMAEEAFRRSTGKRPYPLPEKFLTELQSMPPSAGIALGFDRLVMVFLNARTVDEVVAFTPEEL